MANEKITDLPGVTNAQLTDIIYAVQGYVSSSSPGTSVQETLGQVAALMLGQTILNNAGNPNGIVAGSTYQLCWDTTNNVLYVCTTTGSTMTAVWTQVAAGFGAIVSPAHGGTGINNGTSTITIGGNFSMIGADTFAGTLTGNTAVTFPTNGTLATTAQIPTGAALTEVNDTNVTLTLGGSPTTALINAASITAGWAGTLSGTRGGTGVNNGASTITIGGNYTMTGAFTFNGTLTGNTSVTFPTSGTLATTSQIPTGAALTKTDDTNVTLTLGGSPTTALVNASSITAGWTGTLSGTRGGTGVNNGASTITLGGSLTTSGAFASTFTMTNTTSVTFPTSGTLATTSQLPSAAALTKTDDTNVTLTLGGTPSTALLQAASITAGWTGTLAVTRGGTGSGTASGARTNLGAAASGANADITSMAGLTGKIEAPTAIASSSGVNCLAFGYTPSAVNYISMNNNSTGQGPTIDANGTDGSVPLLIRVKDSDLFLQDVTGTIAPAIRFYNAAVSQYTALKAATAQATTLTLTLPAADGTANAPMITDGSGNLSFLPGAWVDFSGSIGYTGFTGSVTTTTARYKIIGKTCFVSIYASGTSNATGFTITGLPATVSASNNSVYIPFCLGQNNSGFVQVTGQISTTTLTLFQGSTAAVWTNSGTKSFFGSFSYEIA